MVHLGVIRSASSDSYASNPHASRFGGHYGPVGRGYHRPADAAALIGLAYMYERGQGVPQDHAEAVRWYQKAADRGDVEAQFESRWNRRKINGSNRRVWMYNLCWPRIQNGNPG